MDTAGNPKLDTESVLSPKCDKIYADKIDVSKQLTIIGRGECGKTSILYRLVKNQFVPNIAATPVENEDINYTMGGKKLLLKIWDTSGQDEYSRFRALTIPASDYILVCYSVKDISSFTEVQDSIIFIIKQKAPAHAKIVLCATKIDMRGPNDITTEEGISLAKEIGAVAFFECSALTGAGVLEIFEYIKLDAYKSSLPKSTGFFSRIFDCCG
jgi:small GTP-binding protein